MIYVDFLIVKLGFLTPVGSPKKQGQGKAYQGYVVPIMQSFKK